MFLHAEAAGPDLTKVAPGVFRRRRPRVLVESACGMPYDAAIELIEAQIKLAERGLAILQEFQTAARWRAG